MIQSERRYNSRFLSFIMSWNIQFLLGVFLSIILAGLMVWQGDWKSWLNMEPRFNSLLTMSAVYFLSFISLRQFFNYLGFLNLRYVIPVVLIWTALFYAVLFVFRLSYSVYFLLASTLLIICFFWLVCYLRNRYGRFLVAYIALGNLSDQKALPKLDNIDWIILQESSDFTASQGDIIIADLRANLGAEWEAFLADCTLKHIPVYHSSRLIEAISGRVKMDHLYENDLGSLLPSKSYLLIKRFVDIGLVLFSVPFVLPIMAVTAFLIVLESRGGAFFLQERVGQGGKTFTMIKFRSMYSGTSTNKTTDDDDSRITKVGKIIRKTRIDELPQFYNVLKGEMSLIGPRAEFNQFAKEYEKEIPFYSYRHIVKPGISGWAQVMQGYNYGVEETKIKLEYDFYYIKNFSFSMDLLILFKTIQTILTGFGAR